MSYAAFFSSANYAFPTGLGLLVGGVTYINTLAFNRPAFGWKQVSSAEFKATPVAYLLNDEHNRVRFPKVPGQAAGTEHPPHGPSDHHH